MPLYREYASNRKGRDFIVGDLHGCFTLLMMRLAQIGFDRSRDRLFSVGDMINRGPDSFHTLALALEPWFIPVAGNHEDMLLSYLGLRHNHYMVPTMILQHGGDWLLELSDIEERFLREVLGPRILELPYLLRVKGRKPFQVVHAELDVDLEDITTFTPDHLKDEVWISQSRQVLTMSRSRAKHAFAKTQALNNPRGVPLDAGGEGLPDGSVTYSGHVILPYPIRSEGQVFLDGGAFLTTYEDKHRLKYKDEFIGELFIYNHTDQVFV